MVFSASRATSEWFINTDDNTIDLGAANGGGYAVFGRVTGTGMTVVDAVAALPTYVLAGFGQLPLSGYSGSGDPLIASFVVMNAAEAVPVFPASAGQNSVVGFSGTNSDPALISASLNGSMLNLVLAPGLSGSARLTLVATDSNGNAVQNSFRVDVGPLPTIAVEQPAGSPLPAGGSRAFPPVNLGNSADLTFTIKNTGPGSLRFIGTPSVTVDGADASMFTVTAQPVSPVAASGGSTTFTVRFTPATIGTKTAALHIASNVSGSGTPFDIDISGTAVLSANANLASLVPGTGTLNPTFASGTTSYTATVPNTTTFITFTPTVADNTATVTVDGTAVASGTASGAISLNVGINVINTVVTAQDGTTKTYAVTVTRAPSSNADLASLVPSVGTLTPAFSSGATSYTESVPNATTSITVTPTVADSSATVSVNGDAVGSGAASAPVTLNVGSNIISTVVTAQDGTTKKTYTLTVTRNQPDTKSPSMAVLKPASSATMSGGAGSTIAATGWASDNAGVDQVLVSLNGGPFIAAALTPLVRPVGRVNWSLSVMPENGLNKLVAKALDASGNVSAVKTVSFRYAVPRPEVAGLYTGLATPTADSTNPARQVGLSKVTVSRTGTFTGKLTLGGSPAGIPLAATFGNGGDARFWSNGAPASTLEIRRTGLPPLFLMLNLDVTAPLTQQITGTLREGAADGTLVSTLTLDRSLYTAARISTGSPLMHVPSSVLNPLTDKGAYTCIFQALAPPNEGVVATDYPQGDGWALAKVKSSGAVTVAGKLADGQPFSFASFLSQTNVLPLYLKLYAGSGTVSGPVTFRDVPGQSDANGVGLRWFKPGNPRDTAYRSGWPNGIQVDFLGSKFVVPARPTQTNPTPLYVLGTDNILGLAGVPSPTAVTLVFADGGTQGFSKAAAVDGRNKVIITGPADALNLKATLAASSGYLTGSFKHPLNNKTVSFGGAVYQKLHTAGGYFLYYPPKPPGQPAPGALSGSVGIAP
jgi:hypothetical protein